jgi:hypothetical protein
MNRAVYLRVLWSLMELDQPQVEPALVIEPQAAAGFRLDEVSVWARSHDSYWRPTSTTIHYTITLLAPGPHILTAPLPKAATRISASTKSGGKSLDTVEEVRSLLGSDLDRSAIVFGEDLRAGQGLRLTLEHRPTRYSDHTPDPDEATYCVDRPIVSLGLSVEAPPSKHEICEVTAYVQQPGEQEPSIFHSGTDRRGYVFENPVVGATYQVVARPSRRRSPK